MSVDLSVFHLEDNVSEHWVVNQLPHVVDERVNSLVIDFVLFKFADVQDADVVEPLAPVKASKDKQFLCSEYAGSVSLSSSWCLFTLNWMAPPHGFCV